MAPVHEHPAERHHVPEKRRGNDAGAGRVCRGAVERLEHPLDDAVLGRQFLRRARAHTIVRPPPTLSVWPVMNDAASDARKTTASATSSGRARRPSGVALTIEEISFSLPAAIMPCSRGVSVRPGATTFTRTPSRATSRATALLKAMMAPLVPE